MLFLLFFSVVLAQNECYYGANKRAGSAIVPCSTGSGISACCQLGDLCLADSSCWSPSTNVTYLYGCTDSTYTDYNCPYKCNYTGYYVGLDYCANTTRNEWSCTYPQSVDEQVVVRFGAQQCLNDSIIAFAGPVSLQPIVSLATVAGGTPLYFSEVNPTSYIPVSGYTPSTTASATASKPTSQEMVSTTSSSATSTGSRTSGGTSTSAAASTSTQTGTSESSGLSTGAKAGIGAGIGGAFIAIAAIVIAWMILRRRKSSTPVKDAEVESAASTIPEKRPLQQGPSELASTGRKANTGPSELPESEALVGGSHRPKSSTGVSELPESESNFGTPAPTYTSWSRPQPGQQVYELPAQFPAQSSAHDAHQ